MDIPWVTKRTKSNNSIIDHSVPVIELQDKNFCSEKIMKDNISSDNSKEVISLLNSEDCEVVGKVIKQFSLESKDAFLKLLNEKVTRDAKFYVNETFNSRTKFESSDSLDAFNTWLLRNLPSENMHFDWIWATRSNSYGGCENINSYFNKDELLAQGNAILTNHLASLKLLPARSSEIRILKKRSIDLLNQLALKTNCLCGKWLIHAAEVSADEKWGVIAQATVYGKLGHISKISGTVENGFRVICVYTPNYLDLVEVKRILQAISDLNIVTKSFKSDLYTHLGLYSKNDWKLPPTTYQNDHGIMKLTYQ